MSASVCRAASPSTGFDEDTMKSLGIDTSVSTYFQDHARFVSGEQVVHLTVNGEDKGNTAVRFDNTGNLCFDRPLMVQNGFVIPTDMREGCDNYRSRYPSTTVKLTPATASVEIVLPPEAMSKISDIPTDYQTGGTGGLLNYALMGTHQDSDGSHSDFKQLQMNGGFNFDDWLFRSQQMVTRSDGDTSVEDTATYLQHTFTQSQTVMKTGEVNLNNTLLEGTAVTGVEIAPEPALVSSGSGVTVTGAARTSQARVEIRQQGRLILSTLIPQGNFTLDDVPVTDENSDLHVRVIESDGSSHQFTVPATLLGGAVPTPVDLHFSASIVRDSGSQKPAVISLSDGIKLNHRMSIKDRPETPV